jgi:hypothetical protein
MNNALINNHPFQNFMEPAGRKIIRPTRNNIQIYINNTLINKKFLFLISLKIILNTEQYKLIP